MKRVMGVKFKKLRVMPCLAVKILATYERLGCVEFRGILMAVTIYSHRVLSVTFCIYPAQQ